MLYNLIDEKWIPVRHADGSEDRIAPWQLTEGHDHEGRAIISLAAPRPDFNGALIQFLIGLVQTTMPPKSNEEWRRRLKEPPSPETLRRAFATVKDAFNLDGDGPRFMQDFELKCTKSHALFVSLLLMDAPGEQTEELNKDMFVKRGFAKSLCYSCTACALFAMQTNAPSGGKGHRTSLRGGGPLTTTLTAGSLWETISMNSLCRDEFERLCGNPSLTCARARFPWLGPTRTSQKEGGRDTTPEDCHPAQMYWAMPRRIRLNMDERSAGECLLCGRKDTVCREYVTQNYGTNYVGAWMHPLSPYGKNKQGESFALHPQKGGISYRHWIANVFGDEEAGVTAAAVVQRYRQRFAIPPSSRLACYGYEMDNMKARSWQEAVQPLFDVECSEREEFVRKVGKVHDAALEVHSNLLAAVKKASFDRHKDAKGGCILASVSNEFWHVSEAGFYQCVCSLRNAIEASDAFEGWLHELQKTALALFDKRVNAAEVENMDLKRVSLAREDLRTFNNSKKIRERILQLPPSNRQITRRGNE